MHEFQIQHLIDDINHSLSPEEFDADASRALAAFDVLSGKIIEQQRVKLDCREGCALCCWLRVDVLAHEVFLIAHHIRNNFTADEISSLLSRLAAHSEMVMPLTPFEHATMNVRCPLLHEERCSVYAVRPHSCRRHHSQDFATCQFVFDHPADVESPAAHDRDLFRTLTEAMRQNFEAYDRND